MLEVGEFVLFGWAKKCCCVALRVIKKVLKKGNIFSFLRNARIEISGRFCSRAGI